VDGREHTAGALRSLRERNRVEVIDVLRRRGTASRAEIARTTGLSRSTVGSLVAELQATGLVVERNGDVAPAGPTGGRPGVLLALDPSAGLALGVDFGHSHVRVALADLSSEVLAEDVRRLDVDRAADTALDTAVELVNDVLAGAGVGRDRVIGAGVGLPGPYDRLTGELGSSVILPGWSGLRPAAEVERRLGVQIELDNDANLGALGEATFGVAIGVQDLIYVKLASGVGAGLILDGRLYRGVRGIAGELGHVQVDPAGPICRCGNRGCVETLASGPVLLDLLRRSHGEDLTTRDLVALADGGDVGARRALTDAGRSVGRALADLVNTLNPELVVIGGDLPAEALIEGVRESIARYALPAAAEAVSVTAGVLGERAEVLGALALLIGDTERLSSAGLSAV
jgi:predicted NBD/HSP70 family sugar kinase